MSKPRIALCFSGQMRNYEDCIGSMYSYFLDPKKYDIDVFISTWKNRGAKPRHEGSKNNQGESVGLEQIRPYIKNIKDIEIQEFGKTCPDSLFEEIGILFPMYYKMWRADQLRQKHESKHGFKYDWVVRSRPDLLFRKDSVFSLDALKEDRLYHSRGSLIRWDANTHKLPWREIRLTPEEYMSIYQKDERLDKSKIKPLGQPKGMHDQIAIAKPDIMKLYTDSWLYLDNWIKSNPRPKLPFHVKPRGAKHAHEAMIYQMWIHNIPVSPLNKLVYMTYRG